MLKSKKLWLVVASFSISFGLVTFMILQAQAQKEHCYLEQKVNKQENSKTDFPSISYESSRDNIVDFNRRNKSKKYNKIDVLNPDITENDEEVAFFDWEVDLSAMPVDKSQAIIIGKILDRKAYLSESKTSVYSEFKIEVEKVLKDDISLDFRDEKYLFVERQGGIVQYPSGFETWYFVAGQKMPKLGSKYVIFLTHDFPFLGNQKQDFYLVTAYEIEGGKVFPLDNPSGGNHPLVTTYIGKNEEILLKDLQDAINSLKHASPK